MNVVYPVAVADSGLCRSADEKRRAYQLYHPRRRLCKPARMDSSSTQSCNSNPETGAANMAVPCSCCQV